MSKLLNVLAYAGDKVAALNAAAADMANASAAALLSGDLSVIDDTLSGMPHKTRAASIVRDALIVTGEALRAVRAGRAPAALSAILPAVGDAAGPNARRSASLPYLSAIMQAVLSATADHVASVNGWRSRAAGVKLSQTDRDTASPIGRAIGEAWGAAVDGAIGAAAAAEKAARPVKVAAPAPAPTDAPAGEADPVAEAVAAALQPGNLPGALALAALATMGSADLLPLMSTDGDTLRAVAAALAAVVAAADAAAADAAAALAIVGSPDVVEVTGADADAIIAGLTGQPVAPVADVVSAMVATLTTDAGPMAEALAAAATKTRKSRKGRAVATV